MEFTDALVTDKVLMVAVPVTSKELSVVALDTVKVSFTFNVLPIVEAPPTCNVELNNMS